MSERESVRTWGRDCIWEGGCVYLRERFYMRGRLCVLEGEILYEREVVCTWGRDSIWEGGCAYLRERLYMRGRLCVLEGEIVYEREVVCTWGRDCIWEGGSVYLRERLYMRGRLCVLEGEIVYEREVVCTWGRDCIWEGRVCVRGRGCMSKMDCLLIKRERKRLRGRCVLMGEIVSVRGREYRSRYWFMKSPWGTEWMCWFGLLGFNMAFKHLRSYRDSVYF